MVKLMLQLSKRLFNILTASVDAFSRCDLSSEIIFMVQILLNSPRLEKR